LNLFVKRKFNILFNGLPKAAHFFVSKMSRFPFTYLMANQVKSRNNSLS
jgi:hypothetical protein